MLPRCFSIRLKILLTRCLLGLAMVGAAFCSQAREVYSVVVQDIDYYPIYRADPVTGSYSGYVRALMDAFARHEGIHFDYQVRPIRRMTLEYLAGQYDFALPDNPQWDRAAKDGLSIHYSEPLLTFEDAVFVPADRQDMPPSHMTDYGTIYGFTPWKFQDLIDAGQVELKTASRPINLIRMALAERVTAFNLAVPVAEYHFRELGVDGQFVPAPQLMPQTDSHYHLSSLKHPDLIRAFDRFIQGQQTKVNVLLQEYGLR